jgi:predicted DNA-binding protein
MKMMSENPRAMVLRSINVPPEMDEQLRRMAFVLRRPKADLIRHFVSKGLIEMTKRLGPNPTDDALERFSAELDANGRSDAEQRGIGKDLVRMRQTIVSGNS